MIADKPTGDIIIREWKKLLGDESKIKSLSKNGIEYYYPERIVQAIFGSNKSIDTIIKSYLVKDPNEFNGIKLTKTELATKVASDLTEKDLSDKDNELFNFLRNLT